MEYDTRRETTKLYSTRSVDSLGIRTLGVPEEFGGMSLEKEHEVRTFAIISEEIARGDSGLVDKLVPKIGKSLPYFALRQIKSIRRIGLQS